MSDNICKNCMNFMETTNQKQLPVYECCRLVFGKQNNMNVHSLVRHCVKPTDSCSHFSQKTR